MAAETDTQYAYDNFGRLTWSHVPADSGNNILAQWLSYSYDALGRVTQENGRIGIFASEYDLAGRRTRLTHPDGFYVIHEYLVTAEMSAIRENGSTLLAGFDYDDLGRRTTLTRGNGTTTSYSYDAASRLSQLVENIGGTSHDQTLGFSHNPASQIASNTRSNDAYAWTDHYNVSRGYTANGLNQYTASGAVNPTYDGRGNLIQAGGPNYLYNAENRLRSASGQAELFYDPAGRLVQVSAPWSRWYGYDGPNLLLENNGAVENPYDRRFVFGPGTDEALVWYEGSGTSDRRYLHADERGSIVAVTNDSGAAIGINAYDEYGIPASTNIGRFQYTGQAWLPEIGMYHYKARVYSPYLGRFLQTDPIGYDDGMNLYAYVGNDPVNLVDPTGMCEQANDTHDDNGEPCPPPIVVTGRRPSATNRIVSTGAGLIGAAATNLAPLLPGYDLAQCFRQGCELRGWVLAGTDLTPVGRAFNLGRRAVRAVNRVRRGCGCFEAGTLVATPDGLRPIEEIEVGDLVLAFDEETGEIAPKAVTDLIRPEAKSLYAVQARDGGGTVETFHATDDHPWRVHGRGWVETTNLRPGDRIDTASDDDLVVTSLTLTERVEPTYNLTVDDWHTFLVGEDQAVVHNVDCERMRRAYQRQLQQHGRRSLENSLESTRQRLAEHEAALARYRTQGGFTSSVEREIRTFRSQIQVLEDILAGR